RPGVTSSAVAPDGSPVAVFAALPAEPGAGYVLGALGPACDVLELGCGAGRLTRALVAAGHRVVAVDESAAMLAEVGPGAGRVVADATALSLGRRFDAVVLASYLVNDRARGHAFLGVAAAHLRPGGRAVVQRYDPVWAETGEPGEAVAGPVTIAVERLTPHDGWFAATVAYTLEGRRWAQEVEGAILDDAALGAMAAGAGLRVAAWLDAHRTWAVLTRP
ncbi:MAG TPA: class I SAM-dependent methyltransferase, partial [Acidimicrobiales bacterium]|nr:class I SAM-dependent methyltransferase [Acidimicrobiales bacterium]